MIEQMADSEIPRVARDFLLTRFPAKVVAVTQDPEALTGRVWELMPNCWFERKGSGVVQLIGGDYLHFFTAIPPSPFALTGWISENVLLITSEAA